MLPLAELVGELGRSPEDHAPVVKSVPNSEPWSVWMRWIAIGRRRRTFSTKSVPRDVDLSPAAGAWAIAFQGHPEHVMPLQDPLDGRRGDIYLVVPLQKEADPEGPVLPLPPDQQDQGDDVGRRREGVMARPSRTVAQADEAVLAISVTPDVEEAPGNPEEPTALAHVPRHLLAVDEHAQSRPCISVPALAPWPLDSSRTSCRRGLRKVLTVRE